MNKGIIIYVPGLLSTGYLHSISLKAHIFFMRRGYEFRVVHAKPAGSIEERAEPIYRLLSEYDISSRSFHLVGHSMGSLSVRVVAASMEPSLNYIKTVTTISGPHHGSIFADKYVKEPILNPNDNDFEQAYKQLTSEHMETWNKTCPDNPNVKYFSMGFTGDTMVTPSSAQWGKYIYTGNCSHLKQMSPYFGGKFIENMKIVIDNLEKL